MTVRGRRLFEDGDYSRMATIQGGVYSRERLFKDGDYSRAASVQRYAVTGFWPPQYALSHAKTSVCSGTCMVSGIAGLEYHHGGQVWTL